MSYLYRTTVEFADTDMAGIMHFSNFFRFMERTEHAFWRSLGLSVYAEDGDAVVSWPRVQATCDYKSPLRFEDEVEVELRVLEIRSKALVFGFRFRRAGTDEVAASGSVTAVCARRDDASGRMRAVEIPSGILEKIRNSTAVA